MQKEFPSLFKRCGKKENRRLFLQDGDPVRTHIDLYVQYDVVKPKFSRIYVEAPTWTPLSVFKLLRDQTSKGALEQNITGEIENFPCCWNFISKTYVVITKTISSMK